MDATSAKFQVSSKDLCNVNFKCQSYFLFCHPLDLFYSSYHLLGVGSAAEHPTKISLQDQLIVFLLIL